MADDFDLYVAGLMPRLAGCAAEVGDRLLALAGGRPLLDVLTDEGAVNRVLARSVRMAFADRYDETDLRQLIHPARLRADLYRLAAAANGVPAREPAPADGPGDKPGETERREPLLRLGTRLGKFEVRGFLGRGASGCVYLANHGPLGIPVALKVFDPDGAGAGDRRADQFRAEAGLLARLSHPNILRLYDFEEADPPYMALEFVHGRSLQQSVEQEGRLTPADAFAVVSQAARGLRAAHRVGVVHQDVKPANILRTLDGTVKLADFGIARLRGRGPAVFAAGGPARVVEGTLAYMAPEQFDGAGDHRSDIYSLGMVLYHALAGRQAVTAGSFDEYAALQRSFHPEPLDRFVPGVTADVARLVCRMTAKDPDDRPANYDELLTELEAVFGLRLEAV